MIPDNPKVTPMIPDNPKAVTAVLLPDRHPQRDLFICDVADAVLKDDLASMEHPFFSLTKKPDTSIRRYENGNKWLEVVPSARGLATIWDKDVLIYCISQMIHKANEGEPLSRHIRITAHDLLVFTNRKTGGADYESLKGSLDRLDGTRIRTNVETGGEEEHQGFGLVDSFKIRRSKKNNRLEEIEVTLSEWVFRAIEKNEVLTISPKYFMLKKATDRRVYEIARKHCGHQVAWSISLDKLKSKCGSKGPINKFRYKVKEISAGDYLPDYSVDLTEDDKVIFRNRAVVEEQEADRSDRPTLETETFLDAKTVAPRYDVQYLYEEWVDMWIASGKPKLDSPDKAFLGFCRKRYQMNPNP